MATTVTVEDLRTGQSGGLPPAGPLDRGDGPGDSGGSYRVPQRAFYTGMTLALAGILMFFMALVSSYIVRKADPLWQPVQLPRLVWVNTLILLASSLTLSRSLGFVRRGETGEFKRWWNVTTLLGVMFLAGQWMVWRQLAAAGVFVATNAASSFFYLLTAAHGLHLLGGVLALSYVAVRNWTQARATQATAAQVTGIYWHFMDGLWVFLIAIVYLNQ